MRPWLALAFIVLFAASVLASNSATNVGGGGGSGSGASPTTFQAARAPVNGSDHCEYVQDFWINTAASHLYYCDSPSTDHWTQIS